MEKRAEGGFRMRSGDNDVKLSTMKKLCLLLLLFFLSFRVFLEFFHLIEEGFLLFLLKGISEAAVVGAMADWFAVVALFRHPLGLPIPHTAIIPRKKEAIGENLGRFINSEFVKDDIIKAKLSGLDLIMWVFDMVEEHEKNRVLSNMLSKAIESIAVDIDSPTADRYIKSTASNIVNNIDLPGLISNLLKFAMLNHIIDNLIDRFISEVLSYIRNNEQIWADRVKERRWSFNPLKLVDERYYNAFKNELVLSLADVQKDTNHELRFTIKRKIGITIYRLNNDHALRNRINGYKEDIINNPSVLKALESVWIDLKQFVIRDTSRKDSIIEEHLHFAILWIVEKYRTNPCVKEWADTKLMLFADLILAHKNQLAAFISETVRKWDSKTISDKLESEVGTDLQFIRINGTIAGGIIGGVLATIFHLLK